MLKSTQNYGTKTGDDSSDEKGVWTFAVAGIVGTQEEWDAIKPAWIKATEGRIFHATDNQSGKGDYLLKTGNYYRYLDR